MKFLEKTGAVTLKELQSTARAMEALNMQVQSVEKGAEINALQGTKDTNRKGRGQGKSTDRFLKSLQAQASQHSEKRCFCCDGTGHFARYKVCPAQNST